MRDLRATFDEPRARDLVSEDQFTREEVRLSNRNSGILLETLTEDITPTGLQYLLNHFDVPVLDAASHTLSFKGAFDSPFDMTMAEIQALPQMSEPVTIECAGNGRAGVHPRSASQPWIYEAVGTSEWTGTKLAPLIDRAGLRSDVVDVSFTGLDQGFDRGVRHRYGRSLSVAELDELDVMLVWGMNGQPLLPQHGAPLRIIVPGWYGMASVKWLSEIEALTVPYVGFQQVETYRYRKDDDDPGRPVRAIKVKSLMVPPGEPDWLTRVRYVVAGRTEVKGRAWAGAVPIERVEFGVDGAWQEAELSAPVGPFAWASWRVDWQAEPGNHELICRAWDVEGNAQPLTAVWDRSGFGNNAVQRVEVYVTDTAHPLSR